MITGWDALTPSNLASRYYPGDPDYAEKVNYVLNLFKNLKTVSVGRFHSAVVRGGAALTRHGRTRLGW